MPRKKLPDTSIVIPRLSEYDSVIIAPNWRKAVEASKGGCAIWKIEPDAAGGRCIVIHDHWAEDLFKLVKKHVSRGENWWYVVREWKTDSSGVRTGESTKRTVEYVRGISDKEWSAPLESVLSAPPE